MEDHRNTRSEETMKISEKSLHFQWGKILWDLTIWRNDIRGQYPPKSLCTYFWVWMVIPPIALIISTFMIICGVTIVACILLAVYVGPIVIAVRSYIDPIFVFYTNISVFY